MVRHGRDAARPVFSAPPTLCFHKSPASRMGRCSCTHCHAPCIRALNSSSTFASSFRILPPPVSSLACARSPLSAFLCGFAVFFRLVFFFLPFRPTAPLPALFSSPARAFTFRLSGVITASCGLLAVCRWVLQVVPVETVLGNIQGTRDSAILSSLLAVANALEPLRENLR